jgi:hypothetical protein
MCQSQRLRDAAVSSVGGTITDPLVGASSPRISRMVVDFPAPFGPRNPVTVPGCTTKLRFSTAT